MRLIRTTIKEPFPVLWSHISTAPDQMRAGQCHGPCYAANSEWFEPFSARTLTWKEHSAEILRGYGFTVSVDVVTR